MTDLNALTRANATCWASAKLTKKAEALKVSKRLIEAKHRYQKAIEVDPQIATAYVQTLENLQSRNPQTRFVAVTTPLTTIQTGPKSWVKRLLGKTPAGYIENAKREEFNAVLRRKFGTDRLFDVAKLESQGGAVPVVFDYEGRHFDALDPALSSDGGHLNDAGKRVVGSGFLKFLATLPAS